MRRFLPIIAWIAGVVMVWAIPVSGEENPTTAPPQPPAPGATAAMTDIHDILPPVEVGADLSWRVPALLAVGVLLIVAGIWWWKRRGKGGAIATIVPELPPEVIAMRALDEIDDARILDGKTFYFRLSAILRQYVSGRFEIGAPEMTTEEFLPCIDKLAIDNDLSRRLKRLNRAMDPVKFGGQMAVERQMTEDLLFTREFVRKTTPSFQNDHLEDTKKDNAEDKTAFHENVK